jgi:hypothetical protein
MRKQPARARREKMILTGASIRRRLTGEFNAATPVEFAGFGGGVLGIAPQGSIVNQAMLRRLAQAELALQEGHCNRVKATGSVEAAKPLQAKAVAH